jgi:hypothetical protein
LALLGFSAPVVGSRDFFPADAVARAADFLAAFKALADFDSCNLRFSLASFCVSSRRRFSSCWILFFNFFGFIIVLLLTAKAINDGVRVNDKIPPMSRHSLAGLFILSLRSGSNIGSSGSNLPRRVNSGVRRGFTARGLQRVSVIGVLDGVSDGAGLVATFFSIRYQTIIASRREISLARQFSRVNLVNRMEINFARHCFGTGFFIIAVQENFRDMLAKSSEANPKQASVADSTFAT